MAQNKRKKKTFWIILIVILAIIAFYIFRILVPQGADLTPVPNPIRDRTSILQKPELEASNIAKNPLKTAYFGDLHVHTSLSFDAFIGGTLATPYDAYRYAKGEPIEIFGKKAQLKRPLDFAAVTDHSEYIGEFYAAQTKGVSGYYSIMAQYMRKAASDDELATQLFSSLRNRKGGGERKHMNFFAGFETTKKAWDIILDAAEKHYQPGKFTTLAGYEWSSAIDGAHLHRNVIFRDMIVPDYPLSSIEAKNAEELWESLATYTKGGSTVLAIPHNSNLSKGLAFPEAKSDGTPIDLAYVTARNTFEPLIEIHQAKGNSEVHAEIWKNDEFADFENYNYLPINEKNYVRYALKKGLEYQDKLGVNPYKFGVIGSTDTHNGTPGATEESSDFNSNHTRLDLNAVDRRNREWLLAGSSLDTGKMVYEALNPGGLAGVWAAANTRGEIWDALKRKETFATSGNRITLRFFGGYDFQPNYDDYESLVSAGYATGVPMGSDLSQIPQENIAPMFIIWATKDPESANLDRMEVIKGWYKDGQLQEKIYTVALSDNRSLKEDGSVPDNGATVNRKTGEWDKSKGATQLQTVWTDPDFDPSATVFYYVRVLELPTPRWNLWDEIRAGIEYPEDAVKIVRERAWSSPIWYVPEKRE